MPEKLYGANPEPPDQMETLPHFGPVAQVRRGLPRTCDALDQGALRVGFLGGSITDMKTGTRWPEALLRRLLARHPGVRISVENAALGATGSDLGAFLVGPAIIDRQCDLVFVEYAVNDYDQPPVRRAATREGVVRQLRASGCDVVIVHTFCPSMQEAMLKGVVPESIADFEVLAEHYEISSVWAGLYALRAVCAGELAWHEWLPDGLHPEARGSLVYAEAVLSFLDETLHRTFALKGDGLPPLLQCGAWVNVAWLGWDKVSWSAPWTLRRWSRCPGIDRVLHTEVLGARLKFPFHGRGVLIGCDFGHQSGELRYRIDGGAWQETVRDRPVWLGGHGWFRPTLLADDLTTDSHVCELVTSAVPSQAGGSQTAIGLIGIIS